MPPTTYFASLNKYFAGLPYIIWYPYDPYETFLINYFSQMWGAYVSAAGMLATDLLICGAVQQLHMHFEHLNRCFLEMRPTKKNAADEYKKLSKYVSMHNEIIRYRHL